jgi:DNA polymerase-4
LASLSAAGRAKSSSASARTTRRSSPRSPAYGPASRFIGVHLGELVPDRLHSLNLFDGLEDTQSRARLLAIMDQLNNKYGMSTLAPATMLTAYKAAPTRIAFHSIPDLF